MPTPRLVRAADLPSAGNLLRSAARFTKNPLGIIGLFVVLIYGLAVVVAGFSPELTVRQRWVMIALVAGFPPAVLATFYRLVTEHHAKLYAPGDWSDEENFLIAMDSIERRRELEEEAVEVLAAETVGDEESEAESSLGDLQARRQLMSLIQYAETLALDAMEQQFSLEIQRDVRLSGTNTVIDGLSYNEDGTILFEVKLVRDERTVSHVLNAAVHQANAIANWGEGQLPFSFSLILVTVGLDEEIRAQIADAAEQRMSGIKIEHSTVVFDFEELQKRANGNS